MNRQKEVVDGTLPHLAIGRRPEALIEIGRLPVGLIENGDSHVIQDQRSHEVALAEDRAKRGCVKGGLVTGLTGGRVTGDHSRDRVRRDHPRGLVTGDHSRGRVRGDHLREVGHGQGGVDRLREGENEHRHVGSQETIEIKGGRGRDGE